MAVKDKSGFDAELFRKIVAMFDAEIEVADTAFRQAFAQLKKNQMRFCDRLVDAEDARQAKEECARVRAELQEAFDRCARHEAEAREMQAIIDRLHERMAHMEAESRENAPDSGRDYVDYTDVQDGPEPPPPYGDQTRTDDAAPAPLHHMPRIYAVFWFGLLSAVLFYAGASSEEGHLLTIAEWAQGRWWWLQVVVVLFGAAWGLYEYSRGNWENRFGQWCAANLASPRAVRRGLYGVLALWAAAYVFLGALQGREPDALGGWVIAGAVGIPLIVYVRRIVRRFGWKGVAVKLALLVDGVGLTALAHAASNFSAVVVALIWTGTMLAWDWIMPWAVEDKPFQWVAGSGGVVLFILFVVATGK